MGPSRIAPSCTIAPIIFVPMAWTRLFVPRPGLAAFAAFVIGCAMLGTRLALAQSTGDEPPKADPFWDLLSNSVYAMLAVDALWGAYCTAMIFLRLRQFRFRNEKQQELFMASVVSPL